MPQCIVIREFFSYTKVTCQFKNTLLHVTEFHFIASINYLILYYYNKHYMYQRLYINYFVTIYF